MERAFTTGAVMLGLPMVLVFLSHVKSLPFAYTIRSWLLLRKLVASATARGLTPEPLFTVISLDRRCLLDDTDYNQHMNNSMYNKMLDFARIETLYRILPRVMIEPTHDIAVHNAGVLTLFRKEIRPFQQYTLESRTLTWNEKWIWIQHRFVQTDAKHGQVLFCLAVSKAVFKHSSGKTVAPAEVMRLCGHDVEAFEERRRRNWEMVQGIFRVDSLAQSAWWEEDKLPLAPSKL